MFNVAAFVESRVDGLTVHNNYAAAAEVAPVVVATHDGSFHCDEAMACGMLRCTDMFAKMAVVRTRVPGEIDKCTAVCDVGGIYDHDKMRYDHHQPEFQGTMHTGMKQYNTRLSSAGLVYKHYGREMIRNFSTAAVSQGVLSAPLTDANVELLYDRLYKGFVEHVDGIDNGVEEFGGDNITRNYHVPTTLSNRIGRLGPRWNDAETGPVQENRAFLKAVNLATTELIEQLEFYATSWLPARAVVEAGFANAEAIHPSKAIVEFPQGGCPWKEHLVDIEKERGIEGQTLYVLYPDGKGGARVQCVPENNSSFKNRKSLPWRGLRDDDLVNASGIPGGVFIHVSGFIGGNKTPEGARRMAIAAVEAGDEAGKRPRPE